MNSPPCHIQLTLQGTNCKTYFIFLTACMPYMWLYVLYLTGENNPTFWGCNRQSFLLLISHLIIFSSNCFVRKWWEMLIRIFQSQRWHLSHSLIYPTISLNTWVNSLWSHISQRKAANPAIWEIDTEVFWPFFKFIFF